MPGSTPRGTEIPLAVRAFRGVMLAADPAFIGADYLQRANNWLPDQTRVLAKRRGTTTYQSIPGTTHVDRMIRLLGADGNRYLYAVAWFLGGDQVWVSENDGAFTLVVNGTFSSNNRRYGMTRLGETLYVGNDTDVLKAIPLGGDAEDLNPLALATDAGATVTATADSTSGMLPGTYSYRWATYNTTTKRWTGVGGVQTTTITGTGWYRLDFVAPAAGLATDELWHLFLTGVDQEIEGAHDQTAEGLAAAAPYSATVVTADGVLVPVPSTVVRRARMLATHLGTVVGAGDATNPRRVWQTSVVPAGLEQDLFDQGIFFPAYGYADLPSPCTGIAVATLASAQRSPQAPLAMFTETSTHYGIGYFWDDQSFQLVDISSEVGVVSDKTLVQTPLGLIGLGQESVYLYPPSLSEPKNVGWPIERALRSIPNAARPFTFAAFHKGFYLLFCAPAGGLQATVMWALDLRQGLGETPSWWGPSTRPAFSAFTRSRREPTEDDRGWAAVEGTGQVVLDQQSNVYSDLGTAITSEFKTARLLQGSGARPEPYQPKLAKRVRAIAKVEDTTTLTITIDSDGALTSSPGNPARIVGSMTLPVPAGAIWDESDWDVSDWSVERETKGTFLVSVPEVRGLGFEVTVTHQASVGVTLRDLELRVQPEERKED